MESILQEYFLFLFQKNFKKMEKAFVAHNIALL
jgi:hypothetical protein